MATSTSPRHSASRAARKSMMDAIGRDAFVRNLRNLGVSFESAYFLCFGRFPR